MKLLTILFLISISINEKYQDTMYFDISDRMVNINEAVYYQTMEYEKIEKNLYLKKQFWLNGNLKSIEHFKNEKLDTLNGLFLQYYENMQVSDSGIYKNGKRDGEWKFYLSNGQKCAEVIFKDGNIQDEQYWNEDGSKSENKNNVNFPPEYPGGMSALTEFIQNNLKYPKAARKTEIQGKVIVGFVLNEKGEITNPHIIKSVDSLLDEEALRAVRSIPKWRPGKQFNRFVNVKMILPITFNL